MHEKSMSRRKGSEAGGKGLMALTPPFNSDSTKGGTSHEKGIRAAHRDRAAPGVDLLIAALR